MFEVAVDQPRIRDAWRRLRFVVDQARAWAETGRSVAGVGGAGHGSLRGYLAWAARQGSESVRAAEAVLPETDTDAVRILTVHAAKGLEFPVVIVTGMSSRPGGARSGIDVIWPRDGGCEFKLRGTVQTRDFDATLPIDEQMDHHERLRLLYVACTRARDHLVVSLHRKARSTVVEDRKLTNAELLARGSDGAPHVSTVLSPGDLPPAPAVPIPDPPPFAQWLDGAAATRARAARAASVSASFFEGTLGAARPRPAPTDRLGDPDDPGLAKHSRDLELPPWNKGRYGTAIGRAVHGVLQTVDLATGDGLDAAVAAQALAEGVAEHADLVTQFARSALDSDVVRHAAACPHWRETYVGCQAGDRILEGVVDLLYRDDDGLVIVDYKTDAVPVQALDARVAFYRPQLAAYAAAVSAATGEPTPRGVLLFLIPHGAWRRDLDDLSDAAAQVHALARSG